MRCYNTACVGVREGICEKMRHMEKKRAPQGSCSFHYDGETLLNEVLTQVAQTIV